MTPTPNTPEDPQEGLVEASPDIVALLNSHSEWTLNSSTGAWSKGEQRLPTDKEMAAAAEIRRLRAALTPSPVQSSPGEVERLREALMECELALPVLATMCGAAGLNAGKSRAIEILKDVRAALTPPSSPASAEVGK